MENRVDKEVIQLNEMLAPKFTLDHITREGCVKYRQLRLDYERKFQVTEPPADAPEDIRKTWEARAKPLGILQSIAEDALEYLLEVELNVNREELTEKHLREWMEKNCRDTEVTTRLMANKILEKEVFMNTKLMTVRDQVVSIATNLKKAITKNCLQTVFTDSEQGRKDKVKALIDSIQYKKLRDEIEEWVNSEKTRKENFNEVLKYAMESADTFQRYEQDYLDGKKEAPTRTLGECREFYKKKKYAKQAKEQQEFLNGKKQNYDKKTQNRFKYRREEKPQEKAKQEEAKAENRKRHKTVECLKCKGNHRVFDCDQVKTKEEAVQLFEEFKKTLKAKRVRNTQPNTSYTENIVQYGRIENSTRWKINLDSGLDNGNIMPLKAIQKYQQESGNKVELLKADMPLHLANDQRLEVCHLKTKINLTIETSVGDYTVKNVWFYLCNKLDEILIGRNTQKLMGIDPESQLQKQILNGQKEIDLEGVNIYEATDTISLKRIVARLIQLGQSERDEAKDDVPELGATDLEEIKTQLDKSIERAIKAGMSNLKAKNLRKKLSEYIDVFRVKLGTDVPMRTEPATYKLKEGAQPVRCKPRYYRPQEREFMHEMIDMLEKHGLIYMNMNARWASPVLIVKRPEGGFRLVCDLRKVNEQCEPTSWPMPMHENVPERLSRAKLFFTLDAHKGYWLVPLARESQEIFSIMTDTAVYTPKRTLQGALNSTAQFQARMTKIFDDLIREYMTIWIDDIFGHAENEEQLLERLHVVLQRCKQYNIKLNPKKCVWFAKTIRWCGRIYDENGVRHDPERIEALTQMGMPKTLKDINQFMYAANWMRSSVVNYAQITQPIYQLIEKLREQLKSLKIKNESAITIQQEDWTSEVQESFENTKIALKTHVELAYPKEGYMRCAFADASQKAWSMVITQIPLEDEDKKVKDQRHEPLAFYGKKWNKSEANWKIMEQECAAIIRGLARGAYLLQAGDKFRLYTDHRNLVYILQNGDLQKHKRQKTERWALELQSYNYELIHISGEENVWADLLSRWGAAGEVALKARRSKILLKGMTFEDARVSPMQCKDFAWPSEKEIIKSQLYLNKEEKIGANLSEEDSIWRDTSNRIIIPENDEDLKVRLYVIAHAGAAGHFREYATFTKLNEKFIWVGMKEEVKKLCNECLHCVSVKGGKKEPRPFGDTLKARIPYEVLQMDFFYVEPVRKNAQHLFKYILVLKDEFSGYVRFYPCAAPTSRLAADALIEWMADYCCCPEYLVSDQGSHFIAETIAELNRLTGVEHHFVTAYSPWGNAVERAMRTLKRTMTVMLSEAGLSTDNWPWILKNVQRAVNTAPRERNRGFSPAQVMLGHQPKNPLNVIFLPEKKEIKEITPAERCEHFKQLCEELDRIAEIMRPLRDRGVQYTKNRSKGILEKFIPGDFVLSAKVVNHPGDKLMVTWQGPFRVVKATGTHTYVIEHLVTKQTKTVHIQRMRRYADNHLSVNERLKEYVLRDENAYIVDKVTAVRYHEDSQELQLQIKWFGFESPHDLTWEPAAIIVEDVPKLVRIYLRQLGKNNPYYENLQTLLKSQQR